MTKRRMWTEEEIDARCKLQMETMLSTVNTKLDFLGARMVDMLGNVGDTTVPIPAQRPGILQEIRDENAVHAEQGRQTDQKLTEFIQMTGKELGSLRKSQWALERGHNRILRLMGRGARWLWRLSAEDKVPWVRTFGAGSVLTAVFYKLGGWGWPYAREGVMHLFKWWMHFGR